MLKKEKKMNRVTVGSDPEFCLTKDGIFCSAIGVVKGDKHKPYKVGKNNYYYDNVMAECTVVPAETKADVIENFRNSFRRYAAMVKPHMLTIRASAEYPKSELKHKDALAIGCEPEFCAYTVQQIAPPEAKFIKGTLRSAGGQLHIGSPFIAGDPIRCIATIRMCDLFIGTMSIFLDKDPTSKKRKELYGKAGRFRAPEHGAEYRSLGNFWIASPDLVGFMFDMCLFIVDFVETGKYDKLWFFDKAKFEDDKSWEQEDFTPASCHTCIGYNADALRKSIDEMDKAAGTKFLELIRTMVPNDLYKQFEVMATKQKAYNLYEEWGL